MNEVDDMSAVSSPDSHPCRPAMVHAAPCSPVPGDDTECACGCAAGEVWSGFIA